MQENNKRILKNTLMLYFRQILIMLVSLYTVRVVLNTLGTEDFGIYNVVGGVVVMFSFLNFAMTSATQRFLNFAMGQNDMEQVQNVYSISFIIHIFIALLVIILAETVGLWFFYNWLNIPSERMNAAFWVYQFSVVSMVVSILHVPYRAIVIAYEKMSFFAFLSIIESALKLGIVFLLPLFIFDNLIIYATLICITGIIILLVHKIYCNRTFETARFKYIKNNQLFKQLVEFSGWSVFGGFANVSKNHGINILLNIFHGVTINTAMGIAMQVNSAVFLFVSNFQTAFNPQIVKTYSAGDQEGFMRLIFRTSKVSFFLLFFFVLPLYINADFVLQIWLKNVPEYAVSFTRLILLISLIDALAGPLWMAIQATGDIKKYQIIISCFIITNIPLSLLLLLLGFNPVWVLIIKLGLTILTNIWRIFFLGGRINLPVVGFLCEVLLPILSIVAFSGVITIMLSKYFFDWKKLIISCVVSTISICCLVFCVGLNKQERLVLQRKFHDFIK